MNGNGRIFNGPVYDPAQDNDRLSKQMGRIFQTMMEGRWWTLQELADRTGDPQASISAQLRHLRKERFGSYIVNKRPRGDRKRGLFEYQLLPPRKTEETQAELFR